MVIPHTPLMNPESAPEHGSPPKHFLPRWAKVVAGGAIALVVLLNLQDILYFLGYREPTLDYRELEAALQGKDWETADAITSDMMRELADVDWFNNNAIQLHQIPCADLQEINRLWVDYSEGQYGLTVQREIFMEVKAAVQASEPGDQFGRVEMEQMTTFTRRTGHRVLDSGSDSSQPGYYPSFGILMKSGEPDITGSRPFATPEMTERLNWCRL